MKSNLFNVLKKGEMVDFEQIRPLETEFHTYLRSVITQNDQGWEFIWHNLENDGGRVFKLRQQLSVEEQRRKQIVQQMRERTQAK